MPNLIFHPLHRLKIKKSYEKKKEFNCYVEYTLLIAELFLKEHPKGKSASG